LERGKITTVEAGIGEVTGDAVRFTRRGIRITPLYTK
jgi:hypothetical protein